jgi:hypothetical protein
MRISLAARISLALLFVVIPAMLPAQDAASSSMADHHMGPWKEMNAFHKVMAATWHPASQKNDLAPLRSQGADLLKTAEAWSASTAPATPVGCASEAVKNAIARVVTQAKGIGTLLSAKADDTKLKEALKELHDTFEVAEHGCAGHGNHTRTGPACQCSCTIRPFATRSSDVLPNCVRMPIGASAR